MTDKKVVNVGGNSDTVHMSGGGGGGGNNWIQLDPNDAFEKLLIPMVETNRKKRADYATEDNAYKNFDRNAEMMDLEGYDALEDCLSMVSRKFGRIVNLRGRDPQNEAVVDSFLDLAVYAILSYGIARRKAEK